MNNQSRILALLGLLGGLLMLFGDLCFYMIPISGVEFLRTSVMNTMPLNRLVLGGSVGPIAGLLYALGAMIFYVEFKQYHKMMACVLAGIFVLMFIVGGAYHSIYATYGFVPDHDPDGIRMKITSLIDALQQISFITGVIGSFLFIYMVLRYKSRFPKWMIFLTPTLWTLVGNVIAPIVPHPIGSVIIGGWINICFIVFFYGLPLYFLEKNSNWRQE